MPALSGETRLSQVLGTVPGAELRALPEAEVLPRLQVLAEQLGPGQTLEATGLSADRLEPVRDALAARLGAGFEVESSGPGAERPVLRVTHLACGR